MLISFNDSTDRWPEPPPAILKTDGLCAHVDPETAVAFFSTNWQGVRKAQAVCFSGCEVLAVCRDYALTDRRIMGVWGGMSHKERRRWIRLAADPLTTSASTVGVVPASTAA